MKQADDAFTNDMWEPRRGRPRKVDALTPAQRARAYRERKKLAQAGEPSTAANFRDASQKTADSNFRDATRKLSEQEEPWYFPGTAEWHVQQERLGRTVTQTTFI